MNSESLVNAIFAGNGEAAIQAFGDTLNSKITDALDVKKVEIASNLVSAPPEAAAETVVDAPTEG